MKCFGNYVFVLFMKLEYQKYSLIFLMGVFAEKKDIENKIRIHVLAILKEERKVFS